MSEPDPQPRKSFSSLYAGLRTIWDAEFPKTCPKCGRVYECFEEYLVDTFPLPDNSGLMGYDFGNPGEHVGLFRNCACNTTIMAFCHDRRDTTVEGCRRRELFGELLNRLVDTGICAQEARIHLLENLRGNSSDLQIPGMPFQAGQEDK